MSQKNILNLGAGNDILQNAVNLDRVRHRSEIDMVWDLNVFPWPFGNDRFEVIKAWAVLEHLDCDLIQSMNECWRILKPGGRCVLKLPYWSHENSYMDPTHRWFATLETPTVFDPETPYGKRYEFYTERKWKIIKGPKFNNAKSSIICHLEVRK